MRKSRRNKGLSLIHIWLGDSGVFEIFIPELKKGAVYKYEIKFKNGDRALKADP